MEYLLFTYPNCLKCEAMKKSLDAAGIAYQEFNLAHTAGKAKIRGFIYHIKRDAQGAVILPTLIVYTSGIVRAVLTSVEEFEAWSKSRA